MFVIECFIGHPCRFWAVSAMFGAMFLTALVTKLLNPRLQCLPTCIALCVASLVWFSLGVVEENALVHQANIRIDILFVWPFAFVVTLIVVCVSVLNLIHAVIRHRRP